MTHALELFKLHGKVALVTGGGRGLGYFMAEGLAEAGADVAVCGRNTTVLDAAVEKLTAIGKLMIEQKSGSIINISSENGQVGFGIGMSAYATTKIGVIGLTRSLAVEWGKHGINVNAILPGNMEEGMMELIKDREGPMFQAIGAPLLALIPSGDFGGADDIKGAALFLASPAGRYVNGAQLVVDGGFTINAGL